MSAFRLGSENYKLNEWLKQGKSISHEEAREELDINQLAQRVADVNNKYMKLLGESPMMFKYEAGGRGANYTRYFFKGAGCPIEIHAGIKPYGRKNNE